MREKVWRSRGRDRRAREVQWIDVVGEQREARAEFLYSVFSRSHVISRDFSSLAKTREVTFAIKEFPE